MLPFLMMLCIATTWAADDPRARPLAPLQGKVVEAMDVESYTYVRLQTKTGEAWAAVPKAPIKVGSEVTVEGNTVMTNFESKSLNRKFDRIVFGKFAGAGSQTATLAAGRDGGETRTGSGKPVDGDVKVAQATGPDARTVAEIVTRKAELKDKPVVVRGKVVKFNPAILGKNWIHLRDGSGAASDGTNDIVVTTSDEARTGDVVLVKGVVRTDRDLGSGYSYKVLVEDAKLQK